MLGKENRRAMVGFQFDLWKVEVPNLYKGWIYLMQRLQEFYRKKKRYF